jgi:hypothetical protein
VAAWVAVGGGAGVAAWVAVGGGVRLLVGEGVGGAPAELEEQATSSRAPAASARPAHQRPMSIRVARLFAWASVRLLYVPRSATSGLAWDSVRVLL